MRELADEAQIERFMRALGRVASAEGRVYLTGGATAVLHGWRSNTIDVDIKLVPDSDDLMREIPGHAGGDTAPACRTTAASPWLR